MRAFQTKSKSYMSVKHLATVPPSQGNSHIPIVTCVHIIHRLEGSPCFCILPLGIPFTALLASNEWVQGSSHVLTGALSNCCQEHLDTLLAQCQKDLGGPAHDLLEMWFLQKPGPGTLVLV